MAVAFRDRIDAGRQLARLLQHYSNNPNAIVLALPRGGVPVGFEAARALELPLDVFIVRKIGVPGHEELAMGAIASGGELVLNDDVIRHLQISRGMIDAVASREMQEIARRERVYRDDLAPPRIAGRVCILVDDGLATGSTMKAAVRALRQQQAGRIVVAVPVAPDSVVEEFRTLTDEIVCVFAPEDFYAVSAWYADFAQTSDEEVRQLLAAAGQDNGVRP
jgi:predicted phosphoribosyltransferase